MPSYSGVWNLVQQLQAVAAGNWPLPPLTGDIGLWAGFATTNVIDYISIASTGNASDFGDLSLARRSVGACASSTRGIFAGGNTPTTSNVIDYVTISSVGNATGFGDLITSNSNSQYSQTGLSSSTRGVFWTASGSTSNVIEYITIASTGNSSDFGDSLVGGGGNYVGQMSSFASTTRGVAANGNDGGRSNVIQYITIASTGNSTDFGDATQGSLEPQGLSNSTRGVFVLSNNGAAPSGGCNIINYVTIASTGDATDFGDLTQIRLGGNGTGASSSTRGVFNVNGTGGSASLNVLEYITIATTGNATDFGDLSGVGRGPNACSNAHGGL